MIEKDYKLFATQKTCEKAGHVVEIFLYNLFEDDNFRKYIENGIKNIYGFDDPKIEDVLYVEELIEKDRAHMKVPDLILFVRDMGKGYALPVDCKISKNACKNKLEQISANNLKKLMGEYEDIRKILKDYSILNGFFLISGLDYYNGLKIDKAMLRIDGVLTLLEKYKENYFKSIIDMFEEKWEKKVEMGLLPPTLTGVLTWYLSRLQSHQI